MTPEQKAIEQWLSKPAPEPIMCGCMGPRGDDPVCRCRMKWYEKVGDDWYWIKVETTTNATMLTAIKHDMNKKWYEQ